MVGRWPVGELFVESGRWNDGALRRRRDDAHGNDVLERFIHAHVEFDDVLLRIIRKKPEVGFGVVGT